jgi:hypothetical protein
VASVSARLTAPAALCERAQECPPDVWDTVMGLFLKMKLNDLPEEALTQVFQSHMLLTVDSPDMQVGASLTVVRLCPAVGRPQSEVWLRLCGWEGGALQIPGRFSVGFRV